MSVLGNLSRSTPSANCIWCHIQNGCGLFHTYETFAFHHFVHLQITKQLKDRQTLPKDSSSNNQGQAGTFTCQKAAQLVCEAARLRSVMGFSPFSSERGSPRAASSKAVAGPEHRELPEADKMRLQGFWLIDE